MDSIQYQTNAKGEDIDMHPGSSNQIGHFLTAVSFGFCITERDNHINNQLQQSAKYRKQHPVLSVIRDMLNASPEQTWAEVSRSKGLFLSLIVGHEKTADRPSKPGKAISLFLSYAKASAEDVHNFLNGRLDLIKVNDRQNGNSYQDLLLTWVGYRFGQNMANGMFSSREEAARWLEMMLTEQKLELVKKTDRFYSEAMQMQGMLQQFRDIQSRIHPPKQQ